MVLTFVFIDIKPAMNIVPPAEDISLWQEYPPTLSLMCLVPSREAVGTIFNVFSMTRQLLGQTGGRYNYAILMLCHKKLKKVL